MLRQGKTAWGKGFLLLQDYSSAILQHFMFKSQMVSERPKEESCSQTLKKTTVCYITSKLLWTVVASKCFHLFSHPRTLPWFVLTAVSLRKYLFSQLLEKTACLVPSDAWCSIVPGSLWRLSYKAVWAQHQRHLSLQLQWSLVWYWMTSLHYPQLLPTVLRNSRGKCRVWV